MFKNVLMRRVGKCNPLLLITNECDYLNICKGLWKCKWWSLLVSHGPLIQWHLLFECCALLFRSTSFNCSVIKCPVIWVFSYLTVLLMLFHQVSCIYMITILFFMLIVILMMCLLVISLVYVWYSLVFILLFFMPMLTVVLMLVFDLILSSFLGIWNPFLKPTHYCSLMLLKKGCCF